jgi:hypothetical protein
MAVWVAKLDSVSSYPHAACGATGLCGIAFVRGNTNHRSDYQIGITIDPNTGIALVGTYASHINWVYDAPQVFVSSWGTPDATFLLLNYPNYTTGLQSFWQKNDAVFPVVQSSWWNLTQNSPVRASVASNGARAVPHLFAAM